jgi:beta-glucosidase/6-phospho-beta-glucosidase/beta-galactosidase
MGREALGQLVGPTAAMAAMETTPEHLLMDTAEWGKYTPLRLQMVLREIHFITAQAEEEEEEANTMQERVDWVGFLFI